ncbi:protein HEXIM-like [Anneissia japonica]|uniref:protein HEXIM-like n=1 Tax=Anneissia japonica TaxID=1529436 RepID=UPI0014255D10|nr:protein HEXIM-like [Anneissia japonica]
MTIVEIMSLTDESDRNVLFQPEGTDGDDEGTEPERSPSPLMLALRQQNSERVQRGGRDRSGRKHAQNYDSRKLSEPISRNNGRVQRNHSNGVHKNHGGGAVKKRRRGRKRHNKKKWKPYTELTWEERKEVDEREATRAAKKRENRPTPYNTTQFLMEDHKVETPDFSSVAMLKNDLESSDDVLDDNAVGGFLEKDFTAVYDDFQSERLQNMSKGDLVSEVLALSSKVNELEGSQNLKRQNSNCNGSDDLDMHLISPEVRARLQSVGDLEATVSQLREENSRLQSENKRLVSCATI